MASEKLTNISVNLASAVVLLGAATTLMKINRAKNKAKGVETQDEGLRAAIKEVFTSVRVAIGD